MRIGIINNLALDKETGVEKYVCKLLENLPLVDDYKNHQFFVYNRKNLKWPLKFGWTQIRLSWEMLKNKLDVLFVPAHTYPLIYPKKLVISIQGLEFENTPENYGFIKRKILRFITRRSARKADKIIVPSNSTKNDLIKYYHLNPKKIFVFYHGIEKLNLQPITHNLQPTNKYILYLGGGHKRKNINNIKKAYEILKEQYKIEHKLVLAGIEKYISEEEKWKLLKNADVFVFPSFAEGFGFPVLEAQIAKIPVIASNIPIFQETLKDSALLINPYKPEEIAKAIYKILNDKQLRDILIKKSQENIKRFSWFQCASETLKIISS